MSPSALPLVGVLGGMGPAATVDFLHKLVLATPARCDQEHVPVIVSSIPQIPDRTAAFFGHGRSPLDMLIRHGRSLVQAGARLIVMPCNTAHLWFEPVQQALGTPMLHMVDAALRDLPAGHGEVCHVGLLATTATLHSGLYVERASRVLSGCAIVWRLPSPRETSRWIVPGIGLAKRGDLAGAALLLRQAACALIDRGARHLILGCSEIPLALPQDGIDARLIDPGAALAKRTVAWCQSESPTTVD